MTQIILDMSSGNTCRNDIKIVEKMIDGVIAIDSKKHEVVFKWQLFEKAGDNIPLNWGVFNYAYEYAKKKGYKTTASVFDIKSLQCLLGFDVPFIKIANRPDLHWLIGEIKRKIPVYVSVSGISIKDRPPLCDAVLACVSKYPAHIDDYIKNFSKYSDEKEIAFGALKFWNISDHTENWDLYKSLESPNIYECHYKLPDSTGLDAGTFARTPEQLKEIL